MDLALQLKDKKLGGKRKLRLDRCKVSIAEGGKPTNKNDKKGGKGSRKPTKKVNETLPASAYEGTRATKEDTSVKPKKHRIRARTIAYKQNKSKSNKN